MKTVAIVGVGLIGGSFGLALRQAGFRGEILGISSAQAVGAGRNAGAISRGSTLEDAAASADLIYLAQPVDRILTTLERLGPIAPPTCFLTDAGSTKSVIVRKAAECVRRATFLGGHPIAGKEQRGVEAADANLFRGRPYILTPTAPETRAQETFRLWLARMGANVIDLSASEHDRVLAFTSHLPQLLSIALAHALAEQTNENVHRAFGTGLLDMTRLALSSPDLWQSIVITNKTEVLAALDQFVASLRKIREAVEKDDIGPVFNSAATFARAVRNIVNRNTAEL